MTTDIAARIGELKRRAPGAGAVVYEPSRSASGKWEAIGPGWSITDPDAASFAGKLEARLDREQAREDARNAPSARDVRQWQYEQDERKLPQAPWWLGNWSAAGMFTRLAQRRSDRARDAARRMQDGQPRNP
jgi:hypothetical protein